MSKLKNAPLVEVVFELKWNISNENINEFQYLIGDLHACLKDNYSFRESLIPNALPYDLFINQPCHRYRRNDKGYPLYQLGPGILTFNTIHDLYEWDDFYKDLKVIIENFINVYKNNQNESYTCALVYFDFFEFDFEKNNILDYINENFNISIEQNFIESNLTARANDVLLSFNYKIESGNLIINLKKGIQNSSKKVGIVIETRIESNKLELQSEILLIWLIKTHDLTSSLFKKIIKEQLYNTFN